MDNFPLAILWEEGEGRKEERDTEVGPVLIAARYGLLCHILDLRVADAIRCQLWTPGWAAHL